MICSCLILDGNIYWTRKYIEIYVIPNQKVRISNHLPYNLDFSMYRGSMSQLLLIGALSLTIPSFIVLDLLSQTVAKLHCGTDPTISLCGPTIKILPYHMIQLMIVVPQLLLTYSLIHNLLVQTLNIEEHLPSYLLSSKLY